MTIITWTQKKVTNRTAGGKTNLKCTPKNEILGENEAMPQPENIAALNC